MGTLVTSISIILFLVLILSIWSRLTELETNKKVIMCAIITIIYIILTLIMFVISSSGVEYPKGEQKSTIIKTFVMIFAPINGIVITPFISKITNNEENDSKRKILIVVIILILAIIEIIYFKNIQLGIIGYSK